jgi:hypothetical protein
MEEHGPQFVGTRVWSRREIAVMKSRATWLLTTSRPLIVSAKAMSKATRPRARQRTSDAKKS